MIPEIGIYYYPWYNAARWNTHNRSSTPLIGEYDSSDLELINHHVSQLVELGVDYIVIELLPPNDWGFQSSFEATRLFVTKLQTTSVKYSFLIDVAVGVGQESSCNYLDDLLSLLEQYKILPSKFVNGKPSLFFFSPEITDAIKILDFYGDKFSIYFPIFLPNWNVADVNCNALLKKNGFNVNDGDFIIKFLPCLNYIQFWSNTDFQFSSNGFVSVIPGYDDLLLERSPQLAPIVERKNGITLIEQFQNAINLEAEHILIYGWNEYFESTVIEPTLENGVYYYELLKKIITYVKNSGKDIFSISVGIPKSMKPVYLNSNLQHSAMKYDDKIPRWDKDYYLAKVIVNRMLFENGLIIFKDVQIVNEGCKSWCVSEDSQLRFGTRVFDFKGKVIHEFRHDFVKPCIMPGEQFLVDVTIDASRYENGSYRISFGIVHEGLMWFKEETSIQFVLPLA